ncbi:PKD domain-containing protein [Ascidiimonas sp. W6]|uniref:PKD domain-containing protein n=1 Tax=Ascidiimonas meishanensis TaxID=3128903 RepID=UPI0030EE7F39
MKKLRLFYLFILVAIAGTAQEIKVNDTLSREASIKYNLNGNSVNFTPETPPLNQIAGAPKAFYTHYWEFGDGHYSTEENPKHTYSKKGTYEVTLWATNNYDTGKPPTTRPKKVAIDTVTTAMKETASMETDFELLRNREPIPNEEMVAILRYKNLKNYATNGKIYLFYNEHKYNANNFELVATRTHHGEKATLENVFAYTNETNDTHTYLASITHNYLTNNAQLQDSTEKMNLALTLEDAKTYYKNWSSFDFNSMEPNEERNIFFTLKTTPEMLKDTSAIISVRGVYVPDANFDNHKVKEMEMEIVTSHDPNKMSSNATFLNYRFVRSKTLKYKIKFQNNGEGPARTIRLETDIPDMLDKATLQVTDMYPKCDICPKKEVAYSCLDTTYTKTQAIFTFKNIYLPGSEQKNVKEYDSTKGFVKYKIKFSKDFHKKKTKSRTSIIFDKNEPIITNYSTTRFLPGISIGVKAGYNSFANLDNSNSYFLGATISPYKSYRLYWQVELLNSFHSYNGNTQVEERIVDGAQGFQFLERTATNTSYDNVDWEVPVLLRYNVNNYIGLGAGVQGTISVSEKQAQNILVTQFEGTSPDAPIFNTEEVSFNSSNSFTNVRTGFLIEVTAGFARIGPSLGARYVVNFEDNFNYLQLYAIWKF